MNDIIAFSFGGDFFVYEKYSAILWNVDFVYFAFGLQYARR